MDRPVNDLATFVEALNLKNAIYIGRHGTKCVAKAVLISINVLADRSQFFQHFTTPFYGTNRPNTNVSQGLQASVLAPGDIGRLKTPRLRSIQRTTRCVFDPQRSSQRGSAR